MSGATIRGIDEQHEHAAQMIARDTRPLGVRFAQFLCNPAVNLVVSFSAITMVWICPQYADIIFTLGLLLSTFALTRKYILPFKLPQSSNLRMVQMLVWLLVLLMF